MLKKIFTKEQLSFFFQIAALCDITGLFLDLVVYHYFPDNTMLKLMIENFNNGALFVMYLIIGWQAIILFTQHNQKFIERYPLIALTIEVSIAIFLFWILSVESDMESKALIFYSMISRFNHSYRIEILFFIIFMILLIDFYRIIEEPQPIDDASVPEMIKSSSKLVIRKHLFLCIFAFGLMHFDKIHKFALVMLQRSETAFFYDLTILEIMIPITWSVGIIYYLYTKFKTSARHEHQ